MFKLWSQTKPDAKKELKPDLGLRSWLDLEVGEKSLMWQHLEEYFFDDVDQYNPEVKGYYEFYGDGREREIKAGRIQTSVYAINQNYKAKNFTPYYLEKGSLDHACKDFKNIFLNQTENVALELLTFYCRVLINERGENRPYKKDGESEDDYEKRTIEWRYEEFDKFSADLNEVFEDFGINVYVTRRGFVPRQDIKITETIIVPVLSFLSDLKWQKVNEHLSTAFSNYQTKDFGGTIRNSLSAIQAFLQISILGKIGKGSITELIKQGQSEDIIPNDIFTKKIFDNIESIFAQERQKKTDAHPQIEKADEKTAKLVLNLSMVFLQHCIQS